MKVRAKEMTYLMRTDPPTTRKVIHPQIKVGRDWCFLPDETTQSKLVECETELSALEIAITAAKNFEEST